MKLPPLLLLALSVALASSGRSKPAPDAGAATMTAPETVQTGTEAVMLLGGNNLSSWTSEKGNPADWILANGVLTPKSGSKALVTADQYADCQLHIEWSSPAQKLGEGQTEAAVLLQGRYGIPLPPSGADGDWQSCDVTFIAPRFNNDGSVKSAAYATIKRNGLLVQDHVEIRDERDKIGVSGYEKHPFKQSLVLRGGDAVVSFRNIWLRELNVVRLLNGADLKGWYSYLEKLGKNNDPEGNFQVQNGILYIRGKNFGYLSTEKAYSNYHLKVVFKWGIKQFAPRATGKRDSGVLYHFSDKEQDLVWPKSIECQVQEGDCGDIWCVGTMLDTPNRFETAWNMKHVTRTANFEKSNGEWNTIEVIANGGQIEHYVNGNLVNSGTNASVAAGKILLQSEGAEVYYKTVELTPY